MHTLRTRCSNRVHFARIFPRNLGDSLARIHLHHAHPNTKLRIRSSLKYPRQGTRTFITNAVETEDNAHDNQNLRLEDDGEYEIIVPIDPHAKPEHPSPRLVPSHILRPPYATPASIQLYKDTGHFMETYTGDGRIVLGSNEEKKLRQAATFARRVLNMAGSLAVVSTRI